jgi:Tol biopolymer transport system component
MPTSRSSFSRLRAAALTAAAILLVSSPPAGATGGPTIAYSSFQSSSYPQIWLANPDGTSPVRLTSAGGGCDGAVFSPDGTRLVYESPRYGWAMLFVIDANGTNEHRLLPTSFYAQSGTWSPDGLQLAFTHSSNNGQPGGIGTTWVVNADGTNLRQLSPAGVDDWIPSWSPDGTRIAFQSDVGGESQLFLMYADGSGRQQITTGPGSRGGPRWSPDGTMLAYSLFPTGVSACSIHIVHLDGTGDAAVTDTTGYNGRPAWSPDGTELTLHSNRSGNFRVYRINVNGTNLRPITAGTTAPGDWNGDWRFVNSPASADGGVEDTSLILRVPNPMCAGSVIRFATAVGQEARIEIFDSTGRLVRTLLRERLLAGEHSASWDTKDDTGRACPAGVYHCRFTCGNLVQTARLVYVK